MMRAFVSILFLGLALAPADAADRTITVDGEACSFKVRFDPGKFSEKQVRDTAGAILGSVLPYPDFAVHPTTDTLTPEIVAADQAACQQSIGRSRGLDLMDIPGLAEFRARKTDQTVDTCAFEAIGDAHAGSWKSGKLVGGPDAPDVERAMRELDAARDARYATSAASAAPALASSASAR